jgi:hypothetical protein
MEHEMKETYLGPHRRATDRRITGRAQNDHILDPYQRQQKLNDRTVCPQCGTVYHNGRWQWAPRPEDSHEAVCAACRRINDKFPAGIVKLHGPFGRRQIEEVVHLARHQEEAEKDEHPLNRIISIEEDAEGIIISTTDIHLPRRIGEAVKRAFHGRLEENFDGEAYFVRINWTSDA